MKTDDYIVHSLKAAKRTAKSAAQRTRKIMVIVKIVDIEISES